MPASVDFSANGIIDIGKGIKVNLSADNGKAGTLLIDPTDVVVGDAAQGDTGVTLSNSSIANALSRRCSAGADLPHPGRSIPSRWPRMR